MTVVTLPGRTREIFVPMPDLRPQAVLRTILNSRTLPGWPLASYRDVYRAVERLMGACLQTPLTGFADNPFSQRASGAYDAGYARVTVLVETIRGACDRDLLGFESWGYGYRQAWVEICALGRQYKVTLTEEGEAHETEGPSP